LLKGADPKTQPQIYPGEELERNEPTPRNQNERHSVESSTRYDPPPKDENHVVPKMSYSEDEGLK
jgi:hypothetical protein